MRRATVEWSTRSFSDARERLPVSASARKNFRLFQSMLACELTHTQCAAIGVPPTVALGPDYASTTTLGHITRRCHEKNHCRGVRHCRRSLRVIPRLGPNGPGLGSRQPHALL